LSSDSSFLDDLSCRRVSWFGALDPFRPALFGNGYCLCSSFWHGGLPPLESRTTVPPVSLSRTPPFFFFFFFFFAIPLVPQTSHAISRVALSPCITHFLFSYPVPFKGRGAESSVFRLFFNLDPYEVQLSTGFPGGCQRRSFHLSPLSVSNFFSGSSFPPLVFPRRSDSSFLRSAVTTPDRLVFVLRYKSPCVFFRCDSPSLDLQLFPPFGL